MVDTTRTKAELLAIFADGQASGEISEQDLRDFIVTLFNPKDGIQLPAGTNTSPALKFQEGVALSTPQPGAVEYFEGHWHITNGSRKAINTTENVKLDTTTVTNVDTEQQLYYYNFVPDTFHHGERIMVDISGAFSNASASDDFVLRAKINGVTVHTINRVGGNVADSGWKLTMEGTMRTVGASGTFVDMIRFEDGESIVSIATDTENTIDTTTDITFEVTVQWGAAKTGNTISCTQGTISFRH